MKCLRQISWVLACGLVTAGLISFAPAPLVASSGQAEKAVPTTGKTTIKGPIDFNSATKEELMAIEGIDDALAQKIIDGRPYRSKTELTTRAILTVEQFNKMKGKIKVKPVKQ